MVKKAIAGTKNTTKPQRTFQFGEVVVGIPPSPPYTRRSLYVTSRSSVTQCTPLLTIYRAQRRNAFLVTYHFLPRLTVHSLLPFPALLRSRVFVLPLCSGYHPTYTSHRQIDEEHVGNTTNSAPIRASRLLVFPLGTDDVPTQSCFSQRRPALTTQR